MGRIVFCLALSAVVATIGCSNASHFSNGHSLNPSSDEASLDSYAMQMNDEIERATNPTPFGKAVGDAGIEKLTKAVAILEKRAAIHSENIANVSTLAYKRLRVVQNGPTEMEVTLDQRQGPMDCTGRQLDVAIDGEGLFRVKTDAAKGDGIAYTRSGNFFINRDGDLVVGVLDGPRVLPVIKFPANTTDVAIAEDGSIEATVAGSNTPTLVGQLKLARFVSPQGLKSIAHNLFIATRESGEPMLSRPAQDGVGALRQNYLEGSNVDLTREQLELVRVARQHEVVQRLLSRYMQNAPAIASGH